MQPVDWNMDPGTFDMGIVNKFTLFLAPAERADVIVDFSAFAGKTLILYNDAPAPVPANDPRLNYYTADPDQTDAGGAPSTLPGYGPNTRTIMQIKVNDIAPDEPFNLTNLTDAFKSNGNVSEGTLVPGAFAESQNDIIVPQPGYDSAYNTTFPDVFANIQDTSLSFTALNSTTATMLPMEFPSIQDEMGEAFDKEYGRMAVLMGVELPKTAFTQTTMLYGFADPPTELVKPGVYGTQIGTMDDGTEIWKITQNGVDTHPVHWHMFEVQLINRVAWDNNIRPPDANELGWKDTVRVNPLQDTIVALRPVKIDLPFDIPNSIRPLDVTRPLGVELKRAPNIFDPTGEPITLVNHLVNFGWEYTWHCHILAHEENDMMRPMPIAMAPDAPSNLNAGYVRLGNRDRVRMNWTDNSTDEINFIVQQSTNGGVTWTNITVPSTTGPTKGTTVNFQINNIAAGTYIYRVYATNVVGDTVVYPAPAVGFPTMTLASAPTNEITVTVPLP
jgi:FtsP/CotA-like multicopper oxidase with cupredoxin domain